jgi:hypothetical protein
VGLEEGLLEDILGTLTIPEHPEQEAEQIVVVPVNEDPERLGLAAVAESQKKALVRFG